jgi:pimeloyl-ACP methyl ester carboxylesterase
VTLFTAARSMRPGLRVRDVGDRLAPTQTLTVNGVEIALLEAGPPDAPLALCLHGFPDSPHTWRHLAPDLLAAGYRVAAPFLRGYAPSAVLSDGRYQTGVLSADANALHDALRGDDRAVIIGHDWGAPATYGAAVHEPDRWRSVVGMAVPPGGALTMALLGDIEQVRRSWYMFFVVHPLSDLIAPGNDLAFIDLLWRDWSPGYAPADDLAHAKDCLREPANLVAAMSYYRAALGDGLRDPALDEIQAAVQAMPPQPTLYLHGAQDGCIGASVVTNAQAAGQLDGVDVAMIDGAGHFLQLEAPAEVNRRILDHIGPAR